MDRRVVILQSAGRVAAMAAGAVLVAAIGAWFAAVGLVALTVILAWGGAVALGVMMSRLWRTPTAAAWLLAMVFGATATLAVAELGRDAVLSAYGHQEQAWVTGYQEVGDMHTGFTTYTELRTRDGRNLEILGRITTGRGMPKNVVVDPDGTVSPQLASDVNVRWDLGWTITGLAVILAAVLGYGIRSERARVSRPTTSDDVSQNRPRRSRRRGPVPRSPVS